MPIITSKNRCRETKGAIWGNATTLPEFEQRIIWLDIDFSELSDALQEPTGRDYLCAKWLPYHEQVVAKSSMIVVGCIVESVRLPELLVKFWWNHANRFARGLYDSQFPPAP